MYNLRNQKEKDLKGRPQVLEFFGGAKRDRTADLLNAIQALSQLSYSPSDELGPKYHSFCLSVKHIHCFFLLFHGMRCQFFTLLLK